MVMKRPAGDVFCFRQRVCRFLNCCVHERKVPVMKRVERERFHLVVTFGVVYGLAVFAAVRILQGRKMEICFTYGMDAWQELHKTAGVLAVIPAILAVLAITRLEQGYVREATHRLVYVIRYFLVVQALAVGSSLFVLQLVSTFLAMGGNADVLTWVALLLFWWVILWMKPIVRLAGLVSSAWNARIVLFFSAVLLTFLTHQPVMDWVEWQVQKGCSALHLPYRVSFSQSLIGAMGSVPLLAKCWNQMGRFFNLD